MGSRLVFGRVCALVSAGRVEALCGIVAVLRREVDVGLPRMLLDSLRRLEYRGYDSSGAAFARSDVGSANSPFDRIRSAGTLRALEERMESSGASSFRCRAAVGHTRWATHGAPTEANAHPHVAGRVALVHNGIVENHRVLRSSLESRGATFESETDSEALARMLDDGLSEGLDDVSLLDRLRSEAEGTFSFVALIVDEKSTPRLLGLHRGCPLALGIGDEDASDVFASSDPFATSVSASSTRFLEEGDSFIADSDGARILGSDSRPRSRRVHSVSSREEADMSPYDSFMRKEIAEQPTAVLNTLSECLDLSSKTPSPRLEDFLSRSIGASDRLLLVGCGTAHHACLLGARRFEEDAALDVSAVIASEFRRPAGGSSLSALAISQSGETIDTLSAMRRARDSGASTGAIVNVSESSMARLADSSLSLRAGVEMSVASTKTFACQLTALFCAASALARKRGRLDASEFERRIDSLSSLPRLMREVLSSRSAIEGVAERLLASRVGSGFERRSHVFHIGRGDGYPLALEGALKLKEVSGTHAEGCAAGELKHGPIALVEKGTSVIAVLCDPVTSAKTLSNLSEARARGASGAAIGPRDADPAMRAACDEWIAMPPSDSYSSPILYALPLQIMACRVAEILGADVDRPRNLAKSVTVE